MKVRTEFRFDVKIVEDLMIPLHDGCILAAKLWLPLAKGQSPAGTYGCVLEYLPYRQRDDTVYRDELNYRYLAGCGFAGLRVDMRGTGQSHGSVLKDEYLLQEQDDCLEVMKWIEQQPWSNGKVGMMGISWGGFNSLQVAARNPPQLKAIVTVCSTDNRYTDDIHFMGGCLLSENLSWASYMTSLLCLPPDPCASGVGLNWKEVWLDRMANLNLLVADWMEHQTRDDYWKHGSVCEDYSAIQVPTYAFGGWPDGYPNSVPRLVQAINNSTNQHKYPHITGPEPRIGFLQELTRWFGAWLYDDEDADYDAQKCTRALWANEPKLKVWVQESLPCSTSYPRRPGRWVNFDNWPPLDSIVQQNFCLVFHSGSQGADYLNYQLQSGQSSLKTGLTEDGVVQNRIDFTAEILPSNSGKWYAYDENGPDQPGDQSEDDKHSICFDSPPLTQKLEICGFPAVNLSVSVNKPLAHLIVRLCEVFPDGSSARISYGALNLNHFMDGAERPQRLEEGKRYDGVQVQLKAVAHSFAVGNKLRLAITTTYWPFIWPSPERVTLTIYECSSLSLQLPVLVSNLNEGEAREFGPPEAAKGITSEQLTPSLYERTSWTQSSSADGDGAEMITCTCVEDSGDGQKL